MSPALSSGSRALKNPDVILSLSKDERSRQADNETRPHEHVAVTLSGSEG
jgi:hypothetical protein